MLQALLWLVDMSQHGHLSRRQWTRVTVVGLRFQISIVYNLVEINTQFVGLRNVQLDQRQRLIILVQTRPGCTLQSHNETIRRAEEL
jgi:hypothetical protein